jgi:hypothetical protein
MDKFAAVSGAVIAALAVGAVATPSFAADYGDYGYGPAYASYDDTCHAARQQGAATGTVIGALAGAALGSGVAHHGDRAGGAVVGAIAGALIGNGVGRSSTDCGYGRDVSYQPYPAYSGGYAQDYGPSYGGYGGYASYDSYRGYGHDRGDGRGWGHGDGYRSSYDRGYRGHARWDDDDGE